MKVDMVIVGAGFAGCTVAERVSTLLNKKVLIIEKRNHIGGNAYDYYNLDGILVQKYGPHIFHTNNKIVWDYVNSFSEWNNYVHKVIAKVNGKEFFLPINIDTMERLYNRSFTSEELLNFLDKKRVKLSEIKNSRDVIISQVGEEIYNLFFKNYTKKQWGVYPEELDPEVTKRLPLRLNRDTRYFLDQYQGIPKYGYTELFNRMLADKKIKILLNTDYKEVINSIKFEKMVYTGPIDYFFNYKHGVLPYRSLYFKFKTLRIEKYQNAAVVNYPNDYDFTRITEFKHFYFQKHNKTTICYEYPKSEGDPYYPIPTEENKKLYEKYKKEQQQLKNIYFVGRLATYRYLNMDQVVEEALDLFNTIANEWY